MPQPAPTRFAMRTTAPAAGQDWCRFSNKTDGEKNIDQVYIYDEIGYWGTTASDMIEKLQALEGDELEVHINSPGGDVFDGVAIHSALKAQAEKKPVIVIIDALAASAASFIAQAGTEVRMARNATMMIHDASSMAYGTAATLEKQAKILNQVSDNIADIYSQSNETTAEEWRAFMREEVWYNGPEAVAAGLADVVLDQEDNGVSIAHDAPDPLQVGQHVGDREPVELGPEGRIHGGVRDPSIGIAGRRVPEGLDESQRRDHDPGVAEKLVSRGVGLRPFSPQCGLVRMDGVVVPERIDEPAIHRPGRFGGTLGPRSGQPLHLLADRRGRVEQPARVHTADDADLLHHRSQLGREARSDRRDLGRRPDESVHRRSDQELPLGPGVDVRQLPVAESALQRRHGGRIARPSHGGPRVDILGRMADEPGRTLRFVPDAPRGVPDDALGWEKFSLLGDSMGAGIATLVAGTVPERVERAVLLEGLGPMTEEPEHAARRLSLSLRQEARKQDKQKRLFDAPETAAERLREAAKMSPESARTLIERGLVQVEGGWTWRADPRLRLDSRMRMTEAHTNAFLSAIRCPVLLVAATDGWPHDPKLFEARVAKLASVEHATVAGHHHVHLDDPEAVAAHVIAFLAR